jgi:ParB family transcriptional regulator, chromosome partitioning protein
VARNALGRGLGALIREPEALPASPAQSLEQAGTRLPGAAQLIDIDLIEPSPFQPRTHFREEALAELALSIQANGIIQPLVLRPVGSRFQLLAGERRWRAAQRAGLTRVPAVMREVDDESALEITLVENIQREDLNPVEEARAFERLLNEFQLTQEEVATRTGKDRTTIANAVRLLRLEKAVLDLIEEERISPGHGRALLAINDTKLRVACAQRAARGGLTVRQLERMATRRSRAPVPSVTPTIDPNTRAAIEQLQQTLGTRVTLREPSRTRAGELVIEYYDAAQLAGIYDRLTK